MDMMKIAVSRNKIRLLTLEAPFVTATDRGWGGIYNKS